MDKKKVVDNIIGILSNAVYENDEILIRQLASANDLLDALAIEIRGLDVHEEEECEHPKEDRQCLSTMGKVENELEYLCKKCGVIFKEEVDL